MPSALVVHDARAGHVADVVCAGLERAGVRTVRELITEVSPAEVGAADLLVVGDAIGLPGAAPEPTASVRRWVAGLPRASAEQPMVAVFDARPAHVTSRDADAAGLAVRDLLRQGYRMAALPATFHIDGAGEPTTPDELYRAYHWGILAGQGLARGRTVTTRLRVRSARPSASAEQPG